ncbi:MAG: recombinase family protein [Pirellulales bacterium]
MTSFKKPQGPLCFGYGRLSTGLSNLTQAVQEGLLRDYWREHLEPAGVEWGGFLFDEPRQGNTAFAERNQGRKVFARARPGDHVVVCRLDRSFRSAADGAMVIQALAARDVQFHSLDLPTTLSDAKGLGVALVMRAVAELERAFVSERTREVIADRQSRGLPITYRAPIGWQIVGLRAKETGTKKSSRAYTVDEQERRLVEAIYAMRKAGSSIERIAIWLMTQRDYPNKRKLDNYKAVEWAIAAKELGYPRETNGKQLVKQWRSGQRPKVGV